MVCLVAGVLAPQAIAAEATRTVLLDNFKDLAPWQASASDQVQARIQPDATGAMCLHYDFGRVSGYAVARRALPLTLPAHYGFTLRLHGQGAANAFQVKWVDASGDNVWWRNVPNFVPPAKALDLPIRQRQIEFAWGPTSDKVLRQPAALELVVASGTGGGAGRLCFERLQLQHLPTPGPVPAPVLTHKQHGTNTGTSASASNITTLDLGTPTDFNGLHWRWATRGKPQQALVQASDDGRRWYTLGQLRSSRRTWQALWLPDQHRRYVRLTGSAVATLQAPSPSAWPDRNSMLQALASTAPHSHHPRAMHGAQNYWTLVGVDGGGANAALLSEDGAIEPQRGGPSLEPLVQTADGRLHGWFEVQAEGRSSTTLREGHLPLPAVLWTHPAFGLTVEAAAEGDRSQAGLIARYTLHNPTAAPQRLHLVLVLRPWQVNPPPQFLNTPGGVAAIRTLQWRPAAHTAARQKVARQQAGQASGGQLLVDGKPWLAALQPPAQVQAAPFDAGDVLGQAATPLRRLQDPQGLASARLTWAVDLAPGERRSIHLSLPLVGTPPAPTSAADADQRLDNIATAWRGRLNRVQFSLPAAAQPLHDSLRAALSHILLSRDGPALQPGTRSYARSWVRDGAMMVAGLLRLGEQDAALEFVRWYSTQLFANGKVPCCVDARGADPVAENDSHGQFIFAVAELWRYSARGDADLALIASLWPQVDAAAQYMERLRQSERSALNQQPGNAAFWGLMPASISHEGYSAKPMHSHWDNFWSLAGWRDAALLARVLGHAARADVLAAQQAEFQHDLAASLAITMAQHQINHLPGAAELGDFDPSSSTLIFSPAGAEHLVPPAVLQATWQRYWDESQRRFSSTTWTEYTPYELRSVSALLRLGQADRAHAMLDFFYHDQRPAGWHQWAEVVDRRPRLARFIGDMPHAWISSDFIRSALDLLAYSRDSDQALVLAAGVPTAWLASGAVGVQGLGTAYGSLGYQLRMDGQRRPHLTLAAGQAKPPGGLWLAWGGVLHRLPLPQPGAVVDWTGPVLP